ncbi:MAG: signal peptidase II [Oscillospiraceae bacterium]|jgi:signal peptidase II|nr:signal peptidase II [Oscillospiraceae bacterium]
MLFFIFAALIALADRLLKLWAASALDFGQVRPLIPGVLELTYAENTGAAFSMLADKRWLLIAVSAAFVALIIYLLLRYEYGNLGRWAAAAVLGGAVGNLIDRVLTGRVVDMLEFTFIRFAVFNIADVFITLGGLLFLVHFIFFSSGGRARREDEPPDLPEDDGDEEPRATDAPYAPPVREPKPKPYRDADFTRRAPRNPTVYRGARPSGRPVDVFLDEKELTETRILEEYDIERRLAEYDKEHPDSRPGR